MPVHLSLVCLLIAACFGVGGCMPHTDPMKGWESLGTVSDTEVPEMVKKNARAFFQTLPKMEKNISELDWAVSYWEDGSGQHAVILEAPHDGEFWHCALIYDRNNRRVNVLKYSTNWSMGC